jgi:hypothetical protein
VAKSEGNVDDKLSDQASHLAGGPIRLHSNSQDEYNRNIQVHDAATLSHPGESVAGRRDALSGAIEIHLFPFDGRNAVVALQPIVDCLPSRASDKQSQGSGKKGEMEFDSISQKESIRHVRCYHQSCNGRQSHRCISGPCAKYYRNPACEFDDASRYRPTPARYQPDLTNHSRGIFKS